MWTCFVLVVVVPTVAASAWAAYSYQKFRRTPACRWRDRVLGRAAASKREAHAVRNSVERSNPATVERRLFAEHLAAVPVGAVERFAGIGPGTVDRLRGAGLRSLADLIHYPFHTLAGFGPSRTADVRAAVKQLLAEARRAFDAGDCPKGREYRQHLQQLEQRERGQEALRDAKLADLSAELDALKPQVRIAEAITWIRFLQGGLPDALPELPPPRPPAVPPAVTPVPPPVSVPANAAVAAKASDPVAATLGRTDSRPTVGEHADLAKLRAFAGFGLMVAKADGRIAKAERAAVREFLAARFGHDSVLARHLDPVLEATEKAIPAEDDAMAGVVRCASPAERKDLDAAAAKIVARGKPTARKAELLARLATGLGVERPQAVEPPKPATPDPRSVLEIEPGAELSAELVRRRFALLFERADPAKAAALGPDFAAMAAKKRTDLRTAAETLIAPFGVPLDPPPAPPPPSDIRHNPDLDDMFR